LQVETGPENFLQKFIPNLELLATIQCLTNRVKN